MHCHLGRTITDGICVSLLRVTAFVSCCLARPSFCEYTFPFVVIPHLATVYYRNLAKTSAALIFLPARCDRPHRYFVNVHGSLVVPKSIIAGVEVYPSRTAVIPSSYPFAVFARSFFPSLTSQTGRPSVMPGSNNPTVLLHAFSPFNGQSLYRLPTSLGRSQRRPCISASEYQQC